MSTRTFRIVDLNNDEIVIAGRHIVYAKREGDKITVQFSEGRIDWRSTTTAETMRALTAVMEAVR